MNRILVDMDNVLTEFDSAVARELTAIHPDLETRKRTDFLFAKTYPEFQDDIHEIIHKKGFYRYLPLAKNALEGWAKLRERGEPVICSSPLISSEYCVEDKLEWLNTHFVPVFGKSVIRLAEFTENKAATEGVALIDDKPSILNSDLASWKHIIYSQEYNKNVESKLRINGWNDPNLLSIIDMTMN